jgi:hypothetical protein
MAENYAKEIIIRLSRLEEVFLEQIREIRGLQRSFLRQQAEISMLGVEVREQSAAITTLAARYERLKCRKSTTETNRAV